MRIYARKSLMEDVKKYSKDMFMWTEVGIKYYNELFGEKYPFGKYDQVFIPEHSSLAMENVGCVTYNETYLFRGENLSATKYLDF